MSLMATILFLWQHFDDLWEFLDTDSSGFMEYDVFMRAFLGEMSESRKTLVRKVVIYLTI